MFCAPSLRGESFGVVLLEAMAAATAVVASDLPGYANVARAGRDAAAGPARATPRRSPPRCAGCSPTPALAAAWSPPGEERAAEFSMDRLAEPYVELYERVATRR